MLLIYHSNAQLCPEQFMTMRSGLAVGALFLLAGLIRFILQRVQRADLRNLVVPRREAREFCLRAGLRGVAFRKTRSLDGDLPRILGQWPNWVMSF
jgi:hypothetical protein